MANTMKLVDFIERFDVDLSRAGEYGDESTEAYIVVGVSGQTGEWTESGVIVLYDAKADCYRSIDFSHCSCDGTFERYDDDDTQYLCGSNELIDRKLLENLDPRLEDIDRTMDWQDCDADAIAVLILHRARENKAIAAMLDTTLVACA